MRRRFVLALLIAGTTVCAEIGLGGVNVAVAASAARDGSAGPAASAARVASATTARVTVRVEGAARAVPESFVGLSAEWPELATYMAQGPAFARVVRLLGVAGEPVSLRIGGETADSTYWPVRGTRIPSKSYVVRRSYFTALGELARAAPISLLADLNLVAQSPRMAQSVGRALRHSLPHSSVGGFEIGNEPDLYRAGYVGTMNLKSAGLDSPFAWALRYNARAYGGDFARYTRAVQSVWPRVRYAGPALCGTRTDFVMRALRTRRLSMLTLHRYEFNARTGLFYLTYPTVAKYLDPIAARAFAARDQRFIAIAHKARIPVKVTEFNAAVGDVPGVTNSYATALWVANTLFSQLAAGIDGVNVHLRLWYVNSPVTMMPGGGGMVANPLFYGMMLVARTLGRGATLMHASTTAPAHLSAWAVRDRAGTMRVLLVNTGRNDTLVKNELGRGGEATVTRMTGASPSATSGVQLAGRTLDSAGRWVGAYHAERVRGSAGRFAVRVPAYSAALVTVAR